MDGGHLKTLRDRGMSLGSGNFGPTIHFAGFREGWDPLLGEPNRKS